jgi:hypothetical protein
VLLAALAMGGAGFAAWRWYGGQMTEPTVSSGLVSTIPSRPAEVPTTVASIEPGLPAPRVVKIGVLPPTASVEVDGSKAQIVEGKVEIAGALGSVHKVRVVGDGREVITDVAISEGGALPPTVGPGVAVPGGMKPPSITSPQPRPPAPVTVTRTVPAPSPPKPSGVTLNKKFE